uniref:ATP-dependent Clp protease proteolytic subunit n=1 Tax=Gloeochaete wittrockiana TaxID=38269 RepID=A0A3G1IWC7_9EUKA|nr:ATP-dependent Clp protease proteolytic subunit [Gloeochaete wittrockiana]ASQ40249.1 ATP-dependent Clp protease proteolytic subunit [Gloeochaete wittrockiana]
MAIGIPKVFFSSSLTKQAEKPLAEQWVDIYDYFYLYKIIFLSDLLDAEQSNKIIAILLYLENEEASISRDTSSIKMYLNCYGYEIGAVLSLIEILLSIGLKTRVSTLCLGFVGGCASVLLAAGSSKERAAFQNSRITLEQPTKPKIFRQATDIAIHHNYFVKQFDRLLHFYSSLTSQKKEKIKKDCERKVWFSAHEAQKYNLIDKIIYNA